MKHMKKTYSVLVLLALTALLLSACSGIQPAPAVPSAAPGQATPAAQGNQPTQPAQPAQTGQPAQAGQTPAAQPQSPPASVLQLSGTVWQWNKTTYNDGRTITVSNPANYTIEFFLADGKVAVKADCNNVQGSYTPDANNLTITLGPSTMAACPPGSLDTEYLKELGEVAQYLIQGNTLTLNFKLDSGGMTFTPAAAQPAQPAAVPGQDLGGKQWQWVKTNLSNGQTVNSSNPASYTIAFSMTDGKVAITADCNNAVGEFMTDGQNLQIMIGGVTRAACQPGSLSDEFLTELSQVSSYQVQGDTLTFTTSGGTMTLTAGPATAQPAAPPATAQPAAPTGPAASLEGTTWNWNNTAYSNGSTVAAPDPTKYTLRFVQATKRFIFVADCNNGSGIYTVNGQNLTTQVQGMTRAYCPSPSDEYVQMLDQVSSYNINGSTLSLSLKTNGTMTFTAGTTQPAAGATQPAAGAGSSAATPAASAGGSSAATPVAPTGSNLQRLTSGVWKWQQSADSSGQTWTAPNPASYTIQFNPDGTLAMKVDCNTGSGSYQADESNLTIQLGATTLMACPPPTLENEFRQQLGQVASYFFDGNNLVLLWKMDSGSMKFAQ